MLLYIKSGNRFNHNKLADIENIELVGGFPNILRHMLHFGTSCHFILEEILSVIISFSNEMCFCFIQIRINDLFALSRLPAKLVYHGQVSFEEI